MFQLDTRIQSSTFALGDWPLSQILLKNAQEYPWLIIVPRQQTVREIYQLSKHDRLQLMEEISQLSILVSDYFKPDKINVASLGNEVPQLHVHIVGRRATDILWPQGIWQSAGATTPYESEQLATLLPDLRDLVQKSVPILDEQASVP